MTVGDARKFLKQAMTDRNLRDRVNEAPTQHALIEILKAHQFHFTQTELEEAYNTVLVQSQTAEEASQVREIKRWWDFVIAATRG